MTWPILDLYEKSISRAGSLGFLEVVVAGGGLLGGLKVESGGGVRRR